MKRSDFKLEPELKGMKVADIKKHVGAFNKHYAIKGYSKLKKTELVRAVVSAQKRLLQSKKTKKKVKLVVVEAPAKKASPVAKKASPVAKKASPVAKEAEKSPLTLDETEDLQNLETNYLALEHLNNSNRPYGTYDDKEVADQMKRSFKAYVDFRRTEPAKIVIKFMKTTLSKLGLPLNRVDRSVPGYAKTMYDNIRYQFDRGLGNYRDDVRNDDPIIYRGELQVYMKAILRAADKITGKK